MSVDDLLQKKIFDLLVADTTLDTLLGGEAATRIKWSHIPPSSADQVPMVVFKRTGFKEDPKWRNLRVGVITFKFWVYGAQASAKETTDILQRLVTVLDGHQKQMTCPSHLVAAAMCLEGGPEFYDEAVQLYGKDLGLELTVEVRDAGA